MAVEKISNRQLLFMLFITRSVLAITLLPALSSGRAGQDAWLSVIIATLGSLLLVLIIVGLSVKYPGQTPVEYSQELLGPLGGRIVSLIPLFVFFFLAATEVRVYAEIINTAFLPRTPIVFIAGSTLLLSAIGVYMDIEVLGRAANFFLIWFSFFLFVSLLLPLPEIMPHYYEPVLARGLEPVISSVLVPIAVGNQFMAAGFLLPRVHFPEKGLRTVLLAVLISMVTVLLATLVVIGKMGPFEGTRVAFPLLTTIRAIENSEFLERLEIFLVLAWGLGIFISTSTFLYCGVTGVSQWFKTEDYRPLVFPAGIIVVTLSMHLYESIFQLRSFILAPEIAFPYSMVTILVPFGLLWGAYLVKIINSRKG